MRCSDYYINANGYCGRMIVLHFFERITLRIGPFCRNFDMGWGETK